MHLAAENSPVQTESESQMKSFLQTFRKATRRRWIICVFVFFLQLFVNDAQINSSNLLCGKGVIHGLSAVLHINRNRCDKVTYSKVKVTSTHSDFHITRQQRSVECCCNSDELLCSHRGHVETVYCPKPKNVPVAPTMM